MRLRLFWRNPLRRQASTFILTFPLAQIVSTEWSGLSKEPQVVIGTVHRPRPMLSQAATKDLYHAAVLSLSLGNFQEAAEMYETASINGSGIHARDSTYELARLRERGCWFSKVSECGIGRDTTVALWLYAKAAKLGHPRAQLTLAVAMSSGAYALGSTQEMKALKQLVLTDQNTSVVDVAILLEYFAAVGGNPVAAMALGWRHLHRHAVPSSCHTAMQYYEAAADAAIEAIHRDGVPRPNDRARLTDDARAARAKSAILHVVDKLVEHHQTIMQTVRASLRRLPQRSGFQAEHPSDSLSNKWRYPQATMAHEPAQYPREDFHAEQTTRWPGLMAFTRRFLAGSETSSQVSVDGEDDFWAFGGFVDRSGDVLRYYRYAAEQGDAQAQLALGHLHYHGSRGVKQDLSKAASYFERAAKQGDTSAASWFGHMLAKGLGATKNELMAMQWLKIGEAVGDAVALNAIGLLTLKGFIPSDEPHAPPTNRNSVAVTSSLLPLRDSAPKTALRPTARDRTAEGTERVPRASYDAATRYFRAASEKGHADALYNLGMMQLGWDGRDETEGDVLPQFMNAMFGSRITTRTDLPRSQTDILRMQQKPRQDATQVVQKALQFFSLAAQSGHLRAYQKVGWMYSRGVGVSRSCDVAVTAFKAIAERGPWVVQLAEAYALFKAADLLGARLLYARLAHAGYEVAQSNAAWIIEHEAAKWKRSGHSLRDMSPTSLALSMCANVSFEGCERRSLRLYQLATLQGNADASLKLGDMYYYGVGVSDKSVQWPWSVSPVLSGGSHHLETAVRHYAAAHELRSARATFNLAWCYQHGIGVSQKDLHLAKRHYGLAADMANEAIWPTRLALLSVYAQWGLYEANAHLLLLFRRLRRADLATDEFVSLSLRSQGTIDTIMVSLCFSIFFLLVATRLLRRQARTSTRM